MKQNNYNRIAWCYDTLSHLVFGNAIKNAQIKMLPFIDAKSKILIVGGGTGWILKEITKLHSSGLLITYIDASEKMIALSQKRYTALNKVDFINQPVEEISLKPLDYDIIITSFFLDNFSQSSCEVIFDQLHHYLKNNGKWLISDFYFDPKRIVSSALLKSMYIFFKITARIQAKKLPDTNKLFEKQEYKLQFEECLKIPNIFSKVYVKPSTHKK